jgi:response regulator RpfG family c-di-GMP phosphodiesterase
MASGTFDILPLEDKSIPLVVLSTAEAEPDIERSYKRQANWYITKPADFKQFTRVVNSIQDFWLEVVKLPPPMHR